MRRFLIVGCGGSGGATLAYMMDQLRSELASHGITKIPAGWQFVHLDVPTSPSPVSGVRTVRDQGGTYVGTGPQSDSYRVLDTALSQQLADRGALDTIATWAPRQVDTVRVPLSTGAGQYRGLGRMITLSRVREVRDELQRAWDTLYLTSTDTEMRSLAIPGAGPYHSADVPIVLVVSSMAGGAGASMALDICRVLTLVSGVDPRLMGVFMVTPDIFETLPDSAITGVRANALAMLGEIVASQTGAARDHDVALLRALGHEHGEGELTPFARVFPVGRYVGAERTVFGDGTPSAVYRGLGRGLSALMLSQSATQQFVEWDLTNGGGVAGSREFLGWGNEAWDNLPWGTFGFASLSMGRDRYAEYAAQRLARGSVDKLLHGHRQPDNPASDEEQVNAILDNQWVNICRELCLPTAVGDAPATVGPWIGTTVLPPDTVAQLAAGVVNGSVRRYMPQTEGVAAVQWASRVRQVLADNREQLRLGAQQAAYSVAFHWQHHFVENLEMVTTQALAARGMPYATGLVKRLQRMLKDVILPAGQDLARYAPTDLADLPSDTKPVLAALKGTLTNGAEILERVLGGTQKNVETQVYASLAEQLSKAAAALIPEALEPLVNALNESQQILRQAASAAAGDVGLAHLRTNDYAAWPADQDEAVAARFSEANNEVMLTSSADFKARYEIDLPQAVSVDGTDRRSLVEGTHRAVGHVITGYWTNVGGIASPAEERPVIERTTDWRSSAFPTHPDTGDGLIAQRAHYDVHMRPPELLDRARRFVNRPGESFHRFCSVALRDYVSGVDVPESELAKRHQDVVIKFGEAIDLARPLASVNETAMQALHGVSQMQYRYKFSSIPFREMRAAESLVSALAEKPRIDPDTAEVLRAALSDEKPIKRINIFGSYPNYSPLAYTSVVEPASRQWLAASPSQRRAFWTLRRSRPLAASLPMHPSERRIMVAGWILGRALGFIQVPQEPFTQPVRVWDTESRRWLAFPNPLLTPPSEFRADYDWLPAVLEGVLLAMAQSHQPPVMLSMHPYRALRRLYDDALEDPVSGMHTLAARAHLMQWLREGDTGTNVTSVISGTSPAVDVDERAARLTAYLQEFRSFAGNHYMAPGEGGGPGDPGAAGQGTFAVIGIREQASQTPIFRDVAPDVYWATGKLSELIPACAEAAKRPPSSQEPQYQPPVGPVGQVFPIPQLGSTFEVPRGGNF